jgi:riboflavin kinase/FMN adenylyltransferase
MLGTVIPGLGLGRKLGFPTANVEVAPKQIVPRDGVYAVRALVGGESLPGVCSIGTRPTIESAPRAMEIHIDGFEGSIYGAEIGTAFYHRMRDEEEFDSLESLAAQIACDVEVARRLT